jgi:hypothetical protein
MSSAFVRLRGFRIAPPALRTKSVAAVVSSLALLIVLGSILLSLLLGFRPPVVIDEGGTYSGKWQSHDPDVPAVLIDTSEPVTIEDSLIRSRGHLIVAPDGADVTVRNSSGYGLNPNVKGKVPGRFLVADQFKRAILENNYLEGTSGIYLHDYEGDGTEDQSVKILRNRAKNIDGRHSDGTGGFSETGYEPAQFVQLDKVRDLQGVELAWNEIINEPGESRVEDNISIYLSSGTSNSPILIHDNYVKGAYPFDPAEDSYSGGGIMLGDGSANSPESAAAFVRAYRNQIVSTTVYGIAIAAGHDNEFYDNRAVSSGRLKDGSWINAQNVGAYVWDINGDTTKVPPTYYGNIARDNKLGWAAKSPEGEIVRNDWWFPNCARAPDGASLCTGNQSLPGPITREVEAAEHSHWEDKLVAADVTVGPQGLQGSTTEDPEG